MIVFNKASITKIEEEFANQALNSKMCGDGNFTKKVAQWFKENLNINNVLLTTSGTDALEMASLMLELNEGDEIIVPSYTFVSTINAFMLRGAKPVFVDIDEKTMNIDANLIEEKITSRTKAIFPVHYAGVACDMDKIMEIAKKYNLKVVEDAAQAVGSFYKGKPLGTIGDYGCFSFHETKNYAMGEGGAVIVKDNNDYIKAEIVREKGTDRSQFIRGVVDKYTWQKMGSSYLPSDILAAILYGQLSRYDEIMTKRMNVWNKYYELLEGLERQGKLRRQIIPEYAQHNAHMFYIILPNKDIRDSLMQNLQQDEIQAVFHYIPLHTSPMGISMGYHSGQLPVTEEYSERLLRLPIWADLSIDDVEFVCEKIKQHLM